MHRFAVDQVADARVAEANWLPVSFRCSETQFKEKSGMQSRQGPRSTTNFAKFLD
jgi:hypothetical protein